ncbi:MAG: hypothetical protein U0441_15605 [Polyangiaceae bacterium]
MRALRFWTALLTGTLVASAGLSACNLVNGVDQFSVAGGASTSTGGAGGGGTGGSTAPPTRVLWSRTYGSPVADALSGIAMDGDTAVITGFVSGPADFGGSTTTDPGVFVARVDADGATLAAQTFATGPATNNTSPAIALTPDGLTLLAGVYTGTVDFGPGPMMTADSPLFLANLGASPMQAPWSLSLGQAVTWHGPHIVADAGGGVTLFADGRGGSLKFGGTTYMGTTKNIAYLLRAAADGTAKWSRAFSSTSHVYAEAVAVDPTDGQSVVIAGKADEGPLDCGCPEPLATQGYAMFVARYDGTGQCVSQWSYGANTPPHGLAVDADGGVVLAGSYGAAFDVQGTMFGPPVSPNGLDAYILRFNSKGDLLWGRTFGAPDLDDDVDQVVVGGGGDVFAAGHVSGPVDLGDGVTLAATTTSDLYIARFSGADGKALWAMRFPNKTAYAQLFARLAADSKGNLLAGGLFTGTIDFGDADSPHASFGGPDGYLVKLSPD